MRATSVDVLPLASAAVTVMTLTPGCSVMPPTIQRLSPFATPLAPRSLAHVMRAAPKSSAATPSRLITATEVENDGSAEGAAIRTDGALTSRARTPSVADDVLPAVSRAVTVSVLRPTWSAMRATDHAEVPAATPLAPWLLDHVTSARPTSSLAAPPRVTAFSVVGNAAPPVGALIEMTGARVSSVTVRVAVPTLPAASLAVMVMTLAPATSTTAGTDHSVVPVAVPNPPRLFCQVTCVTPLLSLALPPRASIALLVTNVPAVVGATTATAGACESRVTDTVAEVLLPAASSATTVIRLTPGCRAALATLQVVVPAALPLPPRLLVHVTSVTPTSSLDVPDRLTTSSFVTLAPDGVAMARAGALLSDVIDTRSLERWPAASLAVTVMTFTPGMSATPADHEVVPVAMPEAPRSLAQR